MYIVTQNKIINSNLIVEYIVVSKKMIFQSEFKDQFDEVLPKLIIAQGYVLKAYSKKCSTGNETKGGFILGTYETEKEARANLNRILEALQNGTKVLDFT